MRMGPVILLLGTAAFVGWFAPDLSVHSRDAGSPVAETVHDNQQHALVQARPEAPSADETVLTREGDGHFYARADVNQHSTRFLIDTGASVIALTGADARSIGLNWDETQLQPIGTGASGTVYGVPVRLEHVELGAFGARDVGAVIIPEGLEVSLLGQSFLQRLRGVHIDGDRMTLGSD